MSWRIHSNKFKVLDMPLNGHTDDLSGNGYDGTPTSLTYEENSYGKQAGLFDSADSMVAVANNSDLQGLFDGGATVSAMVRADSDGEGDNGKIIYKLDDYVLAVVNEAAGVMDVRFTQYHSTTNGRWITTAEELDVGSFVHIVVTYNSSSVDNDPTMYIQGNNVALTEASTPVGTADNSTNNLIIGNSSASDRTFDGLIGQVKVYKGMMATYDEVLKLWRMSMRGM